MEVTVFEQIEFMRSMLANLNGTERYVLITMLVTVFSSLVAMIMDDLETWREK